MSLYFIVYSFSFLFVLLDTPKYSKAQKSIALWILVIVFTLFRGLRWQTGTDWTQFFLVFESVSWDLVFNYHRYGNDFLEPGYVLINLVIKTLGGGYTSFLVLTNFFILYVYHEASIKYSQFPIITFLFLLSVSMIFPVRQTLATAFVIKGFDYVYRRRLRFFLCWIFVASSVHYSAIVVLPFYYLSRLKIPLFVSIIAFWGSFIIGSTLPSILKNLTELIGTGLGPRFSVYMQIEHSLGSDFGKRSMFNVFSSFVFLLGFHYLRNKGQYVLHRFLFNLFLISLVISNLFFEVMRDFARMQGHFVWASAFLFAHSFGNLGNRLPVLRYVFYLFAILFLFYRLNNSLNVFPELYVPYRTVVQK